MPAPPEVCNRGCQIGAVKVIGQIDIDSHKVDPFTDEDREMLEWLCDGVAKIM